MASRKAQAIWRGTGKEGEGRLTTSSGAISDLPYTFKTRFEDAPGTNPEELIAAAHAGCFSMALAFQLQGAGFEPEELKAESNIAMAKEGEGFKISRSALTLTAKVPGIDQATFDKLAKEAKENCPVSKVLNCEISLDATLA